MTPHIRHFAHAVVRSYGGVSNQHTPFFDEEILFTTGAYDPFVSALVSIHAELSELDLSKVKPLTLSELCILLAAETQTVIAACQTIAYQPSAVKTFPHFFSLDADCNWVGRSSFRLYHLIRPSAITDIPAAIKYLAEQEASVIVNALLSAAQHVNDIVLVDEDLFNARSETAADLVI